MPAASQDRRYDSDSGSDLAGEDGAYSYSVKGIQEIRSEMEPMWVPSSHMLGPRRGWSIVAIACGPRVGIPRGSRRHRSAYLRMPLPHRSALAETFIRLGGFSVIMTRLQHVENQPMTVHQLTQLLSLLAATRCFVRQPLGLIFFRVSCSAAKQVIDAMTDEELRNTE